MGRSRFMGSTEELICAAIEERNLFNVNRAALSHLRHDEVLMA